MASYSYGLAKGLREPCSPYREAYYFGAPLNEPSADGWNCLPELVSQTTSFNLSTIPKGREVLVALLKVQNTPEGRLYFKAEWYRNRDNKLLFTQPWSYTAREGGWVYFYAYLGYVDWEINENGGHRVEFTVSGELDYFKVIQFTIAGIPEEVEPKPLPTGAMGWISERFADASSFFYFLYLETLDWWALPDFVSNLFYSLSQVCSDLSWDFYDFSLQIQVITDRVLEILSWDTIWSWIKDYIPNWDKIGSFFDKWIPVIIGLATDAGSVIRSTIEGWIDALWDKVKLWIDNLQSQADELRVMIQDIPGAVPGLSDIIDWFTNWPGHILSTVNTWWTGALSQVQGLINSAFIEREPFWAGWQDWRDKVTEFFTDHEKWVYDRLDSFFERYW